MLPADATLQAARRWLTLLARSTLEQAAALIRTDPRYTDLSQTQYATALDWLSDSALVIATEHGLSLAPAAQDLDDLAVGRLIFAAAVERSNLPWLPDADVLVQDTDELPGDAAAAAECLGLTPAEALLGVRQVHGRIDLAERARVGATGELALVALLESRWAGSTRHVALDDDGMGYDIAFTHNDTVWHLEVKSTTRRGRLTVYLSRHEHEVARLDPRWRLIVIGLDSSDQVRGLATANGDAIIRRCPIDRNSASKWASVRLDLLPSDLELGLPFASSNIDEQLDKVTGEFAWLPTQRRR